MINSIFMVLIVFGFIIGLDYVKQTNLTEQVKTQNETIDNVEMELIETIRETRKELENLNVSIKKLERTINELGTKKQ